MRNNNGAVVRKLTRRSLGANKKRNFFVVAAIALTAFMMTSVFSVGMSYYNSVNMMRFRTEGIHSHMGFGNPTPQQMEMLSNLSYVRHFGAHHMVGVAQVPGFESGMNMVYPDRSHWDNLQIPTFTNLVGRYATAENEIMMSRAKLTQMGITEPYIGMEIPMSFTIHGSDEVQTADFILSAIYSEFVSAHAGAFTPILVSQAFAERHGRTGYENMSVNLLFRSQTRALEYMERLAQDLNLADGQYAPHPALMFSQDVNIVTMYTTMGVIVAFLMFTGFLLIYNVMYISVSKDVRFYGLLKTLGTTPQQLRRLVYGQVLRLYVLGLPIGLGLAAIASFAIVPAFLTGVPTGAIVSFSPVIYAGGALFALLTALLGAYTSARKAAKISPVEAVKFAGEMRAGRLRRISAKGKPFRMAWRNVFRERKRAMIVLTSLFMSITVFTLIMTIVYSMDIDGEMDAWHTHDFTIDTAQLGLLDENFASSVASIPGVTEVHKQTATFGRVVEPDMRGTIRGIDTSWLLAIDSSFADTIDLAAFERGEIALAVPPWGEALPVLPPVLQLEIEELPATVQFGGWIERINPIGGTWWNFGGGISIVMSNVYLNQLLDDLYTVNLGINVQAGTDEAVQAELSEILGQNRSTVSRLEARQAMEEGRLMMAVLGAGLSAILGLIGIFNFINVMSVGLLVRKREFAALESVGMSKKQLRTLVGCEGMIYWILTIVASLTIGTVLSYGVVQLLAESTATAFSRFVYPIAPIVLVYVIVVAVCTVTPLLAYKSMNRLSLVERLREVE